jgi:thymidylate synthase (FAD)
MTDEARLVTPEVFWIGYTEVNMKGLNAYLKKTQNEQFLETWEQAIAEGLKPLEILKSLTKGKNANVVRTRDVADNLIHCFKVGHGSIFEHVGLNFTVTDCSRIFTHEQVRHRVGVAYSQTSGRYCRLDTIPLVWDPILDPVKELFLGCVERIEDTVYLAECKLGLRKPNPLCNAEPDEWFKTRAKYKSGEWSPDNLPSDEASLEQLKWVPDDSFNMDLRKKLTSAIRRIAPNGQANEIAVSTNIRSLRHMLMMRTAPFAEWEIRLVFNQIYQIVKAEYPLMLYGAKETMVDGLLAISGLKCQPYEKTEEEVLMELTDDEIETYLRNRKAA